jgi:hypothetical protein
MLMLLKLGSEKKNYNYYRCLLGYRIIIKCTFKVYISLYKQKNLKY